MSAPGTRTPDTGARDTQTVGAPATAGAGGWLAAPGEAAAAADLAEGFAAQVDAIARARALDANDRDVLVAAARALALAIGDGHVCVTLDALAERMANVTAGALADALRHSALADDPGGLFVLDPTGRLYLRRYFEHERRLARRLVALALAGPGEPDTSASPVPEIDAALFGDADPRERARTARQRAAVAMAMRGALTIVSGGPGTGKTTTVAAIIAAVLARRPDARIALAAPTGKAAARLADALRARSARLAPAIAARMPVEASTVHRLLGARPGATPRFRHHAANPLPLDLLVVDEASMLDLALASRLFDAVGTGTRVVLLGDKDQLAAVEAGAVFAELAADPSPRPGRDGLPDAAAGGRPAEALAAPSPRPAPLAGTVVWLEESFRFATDSGIGHLAACVRAGDAEGALGACDGRQACRIDDDEPALRPTTLATLAAGYDDYVAALCADPADVAAAFAAFERFRVLAALRVGARGAAALNAALVMRLRAALRERVRTVAPACAAPADLGSGGAHAADGPDWWPGRAVIVGRNDSALRLANGDVGLALPDAAGRLRVHFPDPHGGWRALSPRRLPPHESAFALTVHKAQGSEHAHVALVLPAAPHAVCTRELVYTGVTRASQRVTLVATADTLRAACGQPTVRDGGLADRLREAVGERIG